MPRFTVLILQYLVSFSVFATTEYCQDLDKKLNDMQAIQGNYKVTENSTVKDYILEMQKIEQRLALLESVHQSMMKTPGSFHIENFASEEQMNNPDYRMQLSAIGARCSGLPDAKDECSEDLLVLQDKSKYDFAKSAWNEAHAKHFNTLQLAYTQADFKQMSSISRYLASEKLKKCPEAGESDQEVIDPNVAGQGCAPVKVPIQLETLAINSTEVVHYYLTSSTIHTQAELIKSCESLLNKGYSPLACSGIACQEGQDLVMGNCLMKCKKLEIRSGKTPYACMPDEAAQLARNQRIEKSKKAWGKVARIGAISVIAGGTVAGTAYLIQQIYKDKPFTINHNNTYTHDFNYNYNYNHNYSNTSSTSSLPNTPYYNYNPNSYYNPYSYLNSAPYFTPYQYGYNPYYTPYGTGFGSGAWANGFGF